MSTERGIIGQIGWRNQRIAVDNWEIAHDKGTAKAYCDADKVAEQYGLQPHEFVNLLNTTWLLRFDTESKLYYGRGNVVGMARPSIKRPDPQMEHCPKSLVLYFEFMHISYGPYHMQAAKAMARNGNEMFFDLLPLKEIEHRALQNDIRFHRSVPNSIR